MAVANANIAPGKGGAAADVTEPVDQETESSKPCQGKNNVHWHMEHMAHSREHPDKRQDGRENCNDECVDFATVWCAVVMEEVGHNAQDDSRADEFRKAEEEGEEA